MNGNFWVIFLALIIGTFIGYQIGMTKARRKVHEFVDGMSKALDSVAEEIKKKQKEEEDMKRMRAANLQKLMAEILPKMDPNDFRNKMGINKDISDEKKEHEKNGETETDEAGE